MNQLALLLLALIALSAGGCVEPPKLQPPRYQITGAFAECPGAGQFAFLDADDIRVEGAGVIKDFLPGQTLKSKNIIRLKLYEETPLKIFDFQALLGPQFAPGKTTQAKLAHHDPGIIVGDGWAFIWGRYPMGGTTMVAAGSDGTTLVVWVDDSVTPNIHRVFLLGPLGRHVTVTCTNLFGGSATLDTPDHDYVEVKDPCTLNDLLRKKLADLPLGDPILVFIKNVKDEAEKAGWTPGS